MKHNLSQDKFANLLGISVGTLKNWEQGRRKPTGPANVLLNIAERFPDLLFKKLVTNQPISKINDFEKNKAV